MSRHSLRLALPLILASVFALSAQDPAVVGRFNARIKAELVPIHVMLLPNGKILYVDRHDQGTHDMTPRLWDPAANTTVKTPTPGYDLFCAGHAMLPNGNILFAGGHIVDGMGVDNLSIYDWRTNTWDTNLPHMYKARWYPTNTPLPNGDMLITSGSYERDKYVDMPQIYEWRTRTLRNLDGALQITSLYPFMYVLPGNKVLQAGADSLTRILDLEGRGQWSAVGFTRSMMFRDYGSSVRYDGGKIMICGGGISPLTASVETIDMGGPAPAWEYSDSMHFARRHHTAVMLPDGKVLVTGGTSGEGFNNAAGAVYDAEMWDPATGHWTLMAKAATMRLYHSFSLLLPDGRVLTGGGGHPGNDTDFLDEHPDFEIYDPPYLFKGTRPVIDEAPDTLWYGKAFSLDTKNAGALRVSLLRLACATHAWDHNADYNRLEVQRLSETAIKVAAPADSAASAPGPHMLFLLDSAGIPSVSKLVWLASAPALSGAADGAGSAHARLAVAGNRLRVTGIDVPAGSECRLRDARGKTAAILARTDAKGFLLPSGLRAGAYAASMLLGNIKVTERILIP
jgi:hypothetical protein